MNGRTFLVALLFSFASGLYWWFVGQVLPFVVPMMLNDTGMLLRSLVITLLALATYMLASMSFFGWLARQNKEIK